MDCFEVFVATVLLHQICCTLISCFQELFVAICIYRELRAQTQSFQSRGAVRGNARTDNLCSALMTSHRGKGQGDHLQHHPWQRNIVLFGTVFQLLPLLIGHMMFCPTVSDKLYH